MFPNVSDNWCTKCYLKMFNNKNFKKAISFLHQMTWSKNLQNRIAAIITENGGVNIDFALKISNYETNYSTISYNCFVLSVNERVNFKCNEFCFIKWNYPKSFRCSDGGMSPLNQVYCCAIVLKESFEMYSIFLQIGCNIFQIADTQG